MPDPVFADPRLARIYDAFDGERDDLDVYAAIVEELGARVVADVGCGTGCLALLLAGRGMEVIGCDPAAASLAVARDKPGATAVTWLDGEVDALPAGRADLVTMTGNVAQVFLTDEEWAQALAGCHRALRDAGHLVLETRVPSARAWEAWERKAAEQPEVVRHVTGVGAVAQRFELTRVDLPLVSFRYSYRFADDGTRVVSDSVLRFRSRQEVTRSLERAGFTVRDVRDAPDRPGLEHVFLARRSR